MNDEQSGAPPADPRTWKIFPRNLTARASTIVPGNPVSSRPEAAVNNCYPGLELDARNIQKFFFPGFYFEVYGSLGARLAELTPPDLAKVWHEAGLKDEDLEVEGQVYLWALKGRTSASQCPKDPPTIELVGKEGLYAWRKVRDLFVGPVGIIIGPSPAESDARLRDAQKALEELWGQGCGPRAKIEREGDDLKWGVFVAERSHYLDDEGVLDPDVYQPGELTRTLCTPWTYDFRDCQCFYWASNKPDVVSSEDGKYEHLNFQRKNRDVEPQTPDIAYDYQARRGREIDYAEMMTDWQQLRPVLNGREFGEAYRPAPGPQGKLLSLEEVRKEVTYLATVEHALAVQYLYAYYSVDTPEDEPDPADMQQFRIWSAAQEIFKIALDEMRHFRWANEVLKLIGVPTTAKRAADLGRRFGLPFYMQSLSSPQLQFFVDIERPSRSTAEGLDGMYVGVLRSLQELTDDQLDPIKRQRAVEIVKLIVDEGEGHYLRFSSAQQNLAFFDEVGRGSLPAYVRQGQWQAQSTDGRLPFSPLYGQPAAAPQGSQAAALQAKGDRFYEALLRLLSIAFAMSDEQVSGSSLRKAIGLMLQMNAVNFETAAMGATPLFTLPQGWEAEPPVTDEASAQKQLAAVRALLAGESGASQRLRSRGSFELAHALPIDEILEGFAQNLGRTRYG